MFGSLNVVMAVGLLGLVMSTPDEAPATEERSKPSSEVSSVANANNAFALDLFHKLRTKQGNLFFSPYSISAALTMTYTGARGETATEMQKVLHLPKDPAELQAANAALLRRLTQAGGDRPYQLSVANALWAQKGYPFLPDFLKLLETNYAAGVIEVDYQAAPEPARARINAWVEEQTRQRIKDLLPAGSVTAQTRLVLVNAIYFKGDWAMQFKKESTSDADFFVSADRTVKAKLMFQNGSFGFMQDDRLLALQLPYKGDELSMILLLPRETGKLAAIEESLSAELLEQIMGKLRKQEVMVWLPKFEMTDEMELSRVLSAMGMPRAFSDDADFSGMSSVEQLAISAVMHKAFVKVDEEGTEAAAATAVVMWATAMPVEPPSFRADHPFLFLIRDNVSGAILFMGRVSEPR
jgi:serpin B